MSETSQTNNSQSDVKDKDVAAVSLVSGTGAILGGVATSAPAVAAGGVSGITGYSIGMGGLIAKAACGSVAAISALSVTAAGPVIGGFAGYLLYKSLKKPR